MKLLSLLLSATGVSALVWVSPVVAQTELANISKNATDLSLILKDTPSDKGTPMRGQAASHIAQGETRVTGVEVVPTESGLELILKTAAGSERLVPLIVPEESDLVIDILDATLAFSIRNGVTEVDPAPGIERITVTQADSNSIQVRITGTEQTPSAEVVAGRDDLVLSITPETTTAEEEQEIDIIATGQVEEDTYRVENSNRTGTRTDTPLRDIPQSIQVVPRKVIEDQSINRIGDALRNVSGIGVTRDFGGTNFTFSARGFNDTRILRNGIRSGEDDSPIGTSPTTVDSIEVLKGPGSVLFGIAEPGGVINIITKQPEKEASYDFKFRVGSFDFFEPSIDLAGPLTDDKKLTYRFNVSYQSDGLFRDFVESEALVVAPVLRYEFDDKTDLTFEYEYQQDTRTFDDGIQAFDGFDPFAAPDELFLGEPDNVLDDGVHRFFLTLNHRFNESVRLRSAFGAEVSNESIAAYRTFPFFNFDPETGDIFDRFFQSTPNLASNTFSFQTDLITEFETGPVEHELVAGFDVTFAFVGIEGANIGNTFTSINVFDPVYDDEFPPNLPATTILDLETEEDFVGFFLQDLITLTPKLKLLAGGRFDFAFANSNTFVDNVGGSLFESESEFNDEAFSPRVGIVYQPIEPISLYGSFTRSFVPNGATPTVDGDVIEAERGRQFEVGVRGEIGGVSINLAAYDIVKTNLAVTDPDNIDFQLPIGEAASRGVELDIVGEILDGWDIIATGYVNNAFVSVGDDTFPEGDDLLAAPKNGASLFTTYEIQKGSLKGLGFGAGLFYVGEAVSSVPNDSGLVFPSYVRVDGSIFYKQENWEAQVNFQNLFDEDYTELFDNPVVYPGAPLTVIGSLSLKL